MGLAILVTNQPPAVDTNLDELRSSLDLFQKYIGSDCAPFQHQAKTFRLIAEDKEVFLVAGTAAGKTLAIAVPLFDKLRAGRIRKILLMYPTIALMEDQGRVMQKLAELTGLSISQIQGGMTRSQLVEALNKPVVLATPDAIYWFFHKNIKYNGLLVYALALVDEFVLDEAHLFNGLMLRNFAHLWQRIRSLADILGKRPRLHILTATPTDDLQRLNNGVRIDGRSKCGDVRVEFRPCARFDRSTAMVTAINRALEDNFAKVLVVCNSARLAHQLFEQFKVTDTASLPVKYQLRFGTIELGNLLQFLEGEGVGSPILDGLSARFFREERVTLSELPDGAQVALPLMDVMAAVTDLLERQCWQIKRVLWEVSQRPEETLESLLQNRPLPCAMVAVLRPRLQKVQDLEHRRALVDEWLADALESLSGLDERILCQARKFQELQRALAVGIDERLAGPVAKRLVHEIRIDPQWVQASSRSLSRRQLVYLRWLDRIVDREQAEDIRSLVQRGLESGSLKADCRHIGLWKGTDVPVIVYSGSMAKHARAGLIDVFAGLERAVLISTSAVEVGVDFAADMLVTEECEGNSFLQRFGRVGRHGDRSKAIVLVSGDLAGRWRDLNGQSLSREDFAVRVLETFPRHSYATASALVDAGHYLVNEQLGRIGARLNQAPELKAALPLAEQLRKAEIPVGFGLRSTMPQIMLRDGVTKDPFYLLRYVDDRDLRQANSPFEIAHARVWFTTLVFQKARFNVMVDLNATMRASRVWLVHLNGTWHIAGAKPGIGAEYVWKMEQYFARQGNWNPWLPGNFLLLHGDVYLQRTEIGTDYPKPEPICDDEQNPLFIPAQNYMVLLGWKDVQEAQERLARSPIAEWEELYYDWDGVGPNSALVILEQTTGACFAAYREWMDYVNRRVQS